MFTNSTSPHRLSQSHSRQKTARARRRLGPGTCWSTAGAGRHHQKTHLDAGRSEAARKWRSVDRFLSLSNGLKNLQSPQRIKPPGHFKHRRFSLEIVDPGHLLYKEQGFWSQSSPDTVVLVFGTSGDQRRFAWIRWGHICTADVNVLRTPQQGAHLQAQPSQVVVSQQSTGCS